LHTVARRKKKRTHLRVWKPLAVNHSAFAKSEFQAVMVMMMMMIPNNHSVEKTNSDSRLFPRPQTDSPT
jgi:hypothetical protein